MYQFKFADIGEGIHEGKILKWHFKEGDKVKEGETLVVVETDKVNAELPSPVDGKIASLGAKEGDTIHVGEVLVTIDDGSATEVKKEEPKKEAISEGKAAPGVIGEIEVSEEVMASSSEHASSKEKESSSQKALATPVARQMAKDLGLDINKITGSGEFGRVLKEDIQKAYDSKNQSSAPTSFSVPKVQISTQGDVEIVEITKLRKAIVKSMTLSKQVIPHTVLMDEIIVDKLVDLRNKVKEIE